VKVLIFIIWAIAIFIINRKLPYRNKQHQPEIIDKNGTQVINCLMPGQKVIVGINSDGGNMKIIKSKINS